MEDFLAVLVLDGWTLLLLLLWAAAAGLAGSLPA
jgi:hypothetical protein